MLFDPLPHDKIYSSKLKEFADDNFKFDENGRKLSNQVENTVGKGEIARFEQFLLFPQCFQKACSQRRQKVSLCGNGLILYHIIQKDSSKLKDFADDNFYFDENGGKFSKSVENTVGKGEIAH